MRAMRVVVTAVMALVLAGSSASAQTLVRDVRAAIAKNDLAGADALVAAFRAERGTTPESLAALSWTARAALAAKQYDRADRIARDTEALVKEALKSRTLKAEPFLQTALGAALETEARVMSDQGQRVSAVKYLQAQIALWSNTPIHQRLSKNLNLISLEGQPAPALTAREFLGPAMPDMKGRPVVMFFWAHWCPDCKAQAPVLAEVARDFANTDLLLVGPTRYYGYVAGGADATPAQERAHIENVRREYYGMLASMPVPVSDDDAVEYGMDATPTIVLVDRAGIVRLFHPGNMTRAELGTAITPLVARR